MYDFLLVGSGLFSCVFTRMALDNNLKCLIIDKRDHPFGNCYTKEQDNIHVHMYGPHIFHTNNLDIWTFINRFAKFNTFINKPKVKYQNKLYSFPINLMTLYQIWGVTTPEEASQKLDSVKLKIDNPQNLEEWALSQVGEELYQIFIYGYTKKQWNTEPKNLPSFIIKRLPIRLYFDENYFFDQYQGIPIGGYSQMMQNMIEDTKIILNEDYTKNREYWNQKAKNIVYTGAIDEYFEYIYGKLDYRSLKFEHNKFDKLDFQGNAIINYTEYSVPYTRVIEHKYFDFNKQDNTIVSYEYPANFQETNIPYYPINNKENTIIYNEYKKLHLNSNIIFGGRLAEYRYYDMHQIIGSSIHKFQEILK